MSKASNDLEYYLRGNTLKVYLYMINKGSDKEFGIREIQRAMGFKSPNSALYHLEKLRELGLIVKTESGKYKVLKEVKIGVLKAFIKIGRYRFPRFMLYAIFTTTILTIYIITYPQTFTAHNIFALIISIITSAIFWYETIRAYIELGK